MGYFGGGGKEDAEFRKWVGANYGPPGRISKSDLEQLRKEYLKKIGGKAGNSMAAPAGNAMSY